MTYIISPTRSAETSPGVVSTHRNPATLVATGLTGSEEINIQIQRGPDGSILDRAIQDDFYDASTLDDGIQAVRFNESGTKMFLLNRTTPDAIFELALTTAFKPSTGTLSSTSAGLGITTPVGFVFNSNGTKIMVLGQGTTAELSTYGMTTAYDMSTLNGTPESTVDLVAEGHLDANDQWSLAIDPTHKILYIATGNSIRQLTMTTAFDTSTLESGYVEFPKVSNNATGYLSCEMSQDGANMYVFNNLDTSNTRIEEYELSVNFDISTALTDAPSAALLTEPIDKGSSPTVQTIYSLVYVPDHEFFFFVDFTGEEIYRLNVSKFQNATDENDDPVKLTATRTNFLLDAPGEYRAVKPATTHQTSLFVYRGRV